MDPPPTEVLPNSERSTTPTEGEPPRQKIQFKGKGPGTPQTTPRAGQENQERRVRFRFKIQEGKGGHTSDSRRHGLGERSHKRMGAGSALSSTHTP